MPDFGDDLRPAERRLLQAVRSGQRCDLAEGGPVSAEQMSTWGADRTVRGPQLHQMLTDPAAAGLDPAVAVQARGRKGGPKFKMTETRIRQARSMYDAGEHTVQQIADAFGVSRPTIYRHLQVAPTAAVQPPRQRPKRAARPQPVVEDGTR
jgi:DNA-binding transcriptional ArsR family regulator